MDFKVSEGMVVLLFSCLGRSTSHVVWAFPLQVQQLPFPGSMMEQIESDLNFCLGPFHFNLWLCHLLKLDWLVLGKVPTTGLVWKDFVLKGGKEKKLRSWSSVWLRSPCRCGTGGPLVQLQPLSSFPHSDGLAPDYYLCERGRNRLETENGLKSFRNLWTLKEITFKKTEASSENSSWTLGPVSCWTSVLKRTETEGLLSQYWVFLIY